MPNKKLKKLITITGITLGVYAGFRYLLPLVIPFFIALGLAEGLQKPAKWVQRRLTWKNFRIPLGVIGGALLLLLGLFFGVLLWLGGRKLLAEGRLLLQNLPRAAYELDVLLTGWCRNIETAFHLKGGCAVTLAQELLRRLGSYGASRMMPYVMGNSVGWLKGAGTAVIVLVVIFFGAVFALGEVDAIHQYFRRSAFRREYEGLGRILKGVGAAYGKTQLMILAGTIGICIGGLFLLKNPYYGLLGTVIGILDALPFIGTGAVLVPWALFSFLQGHGGRGAVLLLIYGGCYLLRQLLESKVMGKEAGLSPFLTLAAVYVGIRLFGIPGVLLGPLGFLIIRESVDA
ncbi:MAG: AI-2E family transporter [Lachnospiraceae bacterium]|nr:AI-2E family transporter [Lachnospiraceae bacterium]